MADRSRRNRAVAAPPDGTVGGDAGVGMPSAGATPQANDPQMVNASRPAVETNGTPGSGGSLHPPPAWAFVTGALFGGLTLLFFMALVLLAAFDRPIPCESRFLVVIVLALGGALASSFIGGSAAAKGEIPLQIATRNPIGFSVVGGIAVMLLLMVAGHFGYESSCTGVGNDAAAQPADAGTPSTAADSSVKALHSRP